MKAVFLLAVFVIVAVLAVTTVEADCEPDHCMHYCYKIAGAHGECLASECKCKYCIYKGCRRLCRRQGRIAQCQDERCACL